MRLILVGDLFFALSLGVTILLDDPQNWKFQLGEHLTVTGVAGLFIILSFFTLPFIASAIWAASRTQANGTSPPLASGTEPERQGSENNGGNIDGLRYCEATSKTACT